MEKRNLTKSSMSAAGHDAPDPLFVQLFSIFPRCNLTEEQQTLVDNLRMTSGTLGAETDTEYYQEISAYPEFSDMPRKLEIVNVLPFSNHDNTHLMSFAAFYAFLFIVGTCGNASIIAIINHLRETSRKAKDNSTMIYIWVLCLVDFAAMLPLPMTIMDQVLGFWMFGTAACKLFRLLEHIGKIFSTFILVALSVDRYFAVCHPVYTQIRAKRTVYGILLSLFALTFTLLGPMLYYAHSKELILRQKVNEHTQQLIQMRIFKCVDNLNDKLFVVFTLYIFVLAYVAPLLLMVRNVVSIRENASDYLIKICLDSFSP
uniref:G-protein coupled receptors family 1 profile domain-containing protein n=1 Tax=Plectus sambesii TaxID=2011161 RepID=A0A914X9Z4_9BILA